MASSSWKTFTSEGSGSFHAWLGRLADHQAIDLLREATAQTRGQADRGASLSLERHEDVRPRPGLPAAQTPTSRARVSELEEIARLGRKDRRDDARGTPNTSRTPRAGRPDQSRKIVISRLAESFPYSPCVS